MYVFYLTPNTYLKAHIILDNYYRLVQILFLVSYKN